MPSLPLPIQRLSEATTGSIIYLQTSESQHLDQTKAWWQTHLVSLTSYPIHIFISSYNSLEVQVHMGNMQYAVKYQHGLNSSTFKPEDVLLANCPINREVHLPDITVVTQVFDEHCNFIFYTAAQSYHRDTSGYDDISDNANHATKLW